MFKNLSEEGTCGFVNEGLEVSENKEELATTSKNNSNNSSTNDYTKIHITRSTYSQESLYREMIYRKTPSKSCEYKHFFTFHSYKPKSREQGQSLSY